MKHAGEGSSSFRKGSAASEGGSAKSAQLDRTRTSTGEESSGARRRRDWSNELRAELGVLAEDSPGAASLEERTTRRKRSLRRGDTHEDLTSGKEGPSRRLRKHSKMNARKLLGVLVERGSVGEAERPAGSAGRPKLSRQLSPGQLGGTLARSLSPTCSSWSMVIFFFQSS